MVRPGTRAWGLLLLGLMGCPSAEPEPDPTPSDELEKLCHDFLWGEAPGRVQISGCGNPECIDWPPCQVQTVRIQSGWPRLGIPGTVIPRLLGDGGPAGLHVVADRMVASWSQGSSLDAVALPPLPWEPGLSLLYEEAVLYSLPDFPQTGTGAGGYVLRHSWGRLGGEVGEVDGLGGWLDFSAPEWGLEQGGGLVQFDEAGLQLDQPEAPSFSAPRGAGTSRIVGDIDGDGFDDLAISVGLDLELHSGAEGVPTGASLLTVLLTPDLGPIRLSKFDPQRVGDLTGDSVEDLAVVVTTDLGSGETTDLYDSAHVLVFGGRSDWPSVLVTADADTRFETVFPLMSLQTPEHQNSNVATAPGDINGDGTADFVVSALFDATVIPGTTTSRKRSARGARAYLGSDAAWGANQDEADAIELRVPANVGASDSLSVGDLDSDGFDDVVLSLDYGRWVDWTDTGIDTVSAAIWWGSDIAVATPGSMLFPSATIRPLYCATEFNQPDVCRPHEGSTRDHVYEVLITDEALLLGTYTMGLHPEDPALWTVIQVVPLDELAAALGR